MILTRPQEANVWATPEEIFVQRSASWTEVKEVHESSASWNLVWHYNFYPEPNNNHQYLSISQNGEFRMSERDGVSDDINFTTFWSDANNDFSVTNGKLNFSITDVDLVDVTDNRKIYISTTNNSASVRLLNNEFTDVRLTTEISPLLEENSVGSASVRWEFYEYPDGLFFASSPVFVRAFAGASVLVLTQAARFTSGEEDGRIRRTFSRYRQFARLQPRRALRVEPGQTWELQALVTAPIDITRMSWGLGGTSGSARGNSDFFGEGSALFPSNQQSASGLNLRSLEIPENHFFFRPFISIEVLYPPSIHVTPVPVRTFEIEYLRFFRTLGFG